MPTVDLFRRVLGATFVTFLVILLSSQHGHHQGVLLLHDELVERVQVWCAFDQSVHLLHLLQDHVIHVNVRRFSFVDSGLAGLFTRCFFGVLYAWEAVCDLFPFLLARWFASFSFLFGWFFAHSILFASDGGFSGVRKDRLVCHFSLALAQIAAVFGHCLILYRRLYVNNFV